jgi:hypothetical protein
LIFVCFLILIFLIFIHALGFFPEDVLRASYSMSSL